MRRAAAIVIIVGFVLIIAHYAGLVASYMDCMRNHPGDFTGLCMALVWR